MKTLVAALFLPLCAFAGHPRLFFQADDVPSLQEKAKKEPFASMLREIRKQAAAPPNDNLMYAFVLRNEAYIHLLTGDREAADRAAQLALRLVDDPEFWNNPESKGLSRAMGALNVAVAYDICHDAWPAELRGRISSQLASAARNLMASMGAGANTRQGNNWQAVRYSAAGLAALASDDSSVQDIPATAYRELVKHFRANLAGGVWNPEGIGYTIYPWGFSGPFGIAAARAGIGDLRRDLPNLRDAILPPLLFTVAIPQLDKRGLHPDLSDDNATYIGEGTAGLSFYYAAPEKWPGLKWIYDHLLGASGDGTWDSDRAGTLYSILFYPDQVEGTQPSGEGWTFFRDVKAGIAMERNRFQDENDIVTVVNATTRRADGGHSGPDVNTIRLFGLGAPFLVGGGRTGHTAGQTNLFPGPPKDRSDGGLGRLLKAEPARFLLEGSCLGVEAHLRSVAVDYSGRSGVPALIANAETSRNGRLWRLNSSEFNTIETSGNRITITSPVGSSLVITILEPEKPEFRTGTMLRSTGDTNVGIPYHGTTHLSNKWVEMDVNRTVFAVMTLQNGTAPGVHATRHLHGIEARVGEESLAMDFDSGEVAIGEEAHRLKLSERRSPLRVNSLRAIAIEGGGIRVDWPTEPLGGDRVLIRRWSGTSAPETLPERSLADGSLFDQPPHEGEWTYEISVHNDHGSSAPTSASPVRSWPQGMRVFVEDFAPPGEPSHSLGAWTLRSSAKNAPERSNDAGSERLAANRSGHMSTGTQPIQTWHHWTCELQCNLSSPAAQVEFDLLSNAATGFAPLIRLADGRWITSKVRWEQSKNEWRTVSIPIAETKWMPVNIETGTTSNEGSPIDATLLRDVTGIGLRIVHPINNRWAKVDQFSVRAEPAAQ